MKNAFSLFLFSTLAMLSFAQINESETIDQLFKEWDNPDSPGCSLGIIKNGELIYGKGYGMANLEHGIPNSNQSVFRIASTSKQFTAACIVLLAEKGELGLNDKLDDFFPNFPDYAKQISVQQLLNHTSGIRDYLSISYLKGLGDEDHYTDEDLMNWLVNQTELNFSPGDEFLYSNSGYWLLGQIVEKVSGMNMAEYALQEIFQPLGMNNTHFHNNHNQIVKNRASGYTPTREGNYGISMTTLDMIGDGGIFTCVDDIKKWENAFYNSAIFNESFWNLMTKQGILNNGEVIDYASGLDISDHRGLKTISHGGAFVGFRAEILRFPEHKLSIAIFANRADANPTRMAFEVADVLLADEFIEEETVQEIKEDKKAEVFVKMSSKELERFSNHYWNPVDAYARKIYVNNDTLRYFRNEYNESALLPISSNEFKMLNVGIDVRVKFDPKKPKVMSIYIEGEDSIHFEEYEPASYSTDELKQFEGRFYSQELDVNYDLKMEEEQLILYVNNQQVSPLEAVMENLFSNRQFGNFLFSTGPNGSITSFRLAAGRVKNLKFEKI